MQAALGLIAAPPSAGPFVLVLSDWLSAMGATDARIAAVMKRVVGEPVSDDIPPNVSPAPANEGIDLDPIPLAVPFDNFGEGAMGRLLAANRRHPCVKPFEGQLKWFELPEAAA